MVIGAAGVEKMTAGWCAGVRCVCCVGVIFAVSISDSDQFRSSSGVRFSRDEVQKIPVLRLHSKNDKVSHCVTFTRFLHLAASFTPL